MPSAIHLCPRLLSPKLRVYLNSLLSRKSGKGGGRHKHVGPYLPFSCKCLSLFVLVWVGVLWLFLAFTATDDPLTPPRDHDKALDGGLHNAHHFTGGIPPFSARPLPQLQPFDIHRIGQNIVNLPKRFYQNFANAVDNWAGGQPDQAGVGVLPPPDRPDTVNPKGYGENGEAVVFNNLNPEQQKEMDDGWQRNAFNQYVSDRIFLNRSLPEVRDPECLKVEYATNLPDTSVVMCFHNEAWSVLLRGVHSIINRTPPSLLKEIILVDDFSDMDHLKGKLEMYAARLGKVKVVRTKKREGLIRARLLGASVATGAVITFLDSHIECAKGWAEPLLQRIYEDRKRVVCPVIDVIDDSTFKFHYSGAIGTNLGGFDWNLQFNWHPIPEREKQRRKSVIDALHSPTMAGGLFAIDRSYFEEIGTYDAEMEIWGGENLELSFRVWMCGGTLEIVPCSHIGHIFRKRSPYKWKAGENVLKKNSVRLALVWLDDYAKYYLQRINNDTGDYGDISSRVELRKKLQCKNFNWYVNNVFPELFVPGDAYSSGEIRNLGNNSLYCLDSAANKQSVNKPVSMYPCHRSGGNQYWMISKDGEIRRDDMCIDYAGKEPVIFPCHRQKGNQFWVYDPTKKTILHYFSKKCLEMNPDGQSLRMDLCHETPFQKWFVENYKHDKASNEIVDSSKSI